MQKPLRPSFAIPRRRVCLGIHCMTWSVSLFGIATAQSPSTQNALPASPWSHRATQPVTQGVGGVSVSGPQFVRQPKVKREPEPSSVEAIKVPRPVSFEPAPGLVPGGSGWGPATQVPTGSETPPNWFVNPELSARNGAVWLEGPQPNVAATRSARLEQAGPVAANVQSGVGSTEWQRLPRTGTALVSDPRESETREGLPDRSHLDPRLAQQGISHAVGPMRTAEQAQPSLQDQILLEDKEKRHRIGSLVSQQLLKDADMPVESKPTAIEPPMGWRAIEKDLRGRLERCDQLLKRRAYLSAKQEILTAMRQLMRALDERRGEWRSEPQLDLALQAFREEADFQSSLKTPEQAVSVATIVSTHQTAVLKGMQLDRLAPDTAAQYYHQYAKDQLVLAAERHGFAADLYYAYGKCLERLASVETSSRTMLLSQAAVCYQAALIIRADQSDAANELGYVLLQLDRNTEAFDALQYSLKLRPTPETYRNLVEVYRRHEDMQGQKWAVDQLASLERQLPRTNPNMPVVQEVSPEVFASLSPRNDAMFGPGMSAGPASMMAGGGPWVNPQGSGAGSGPAVQMANSFSTPKVAR